MIAVQFGTRMRADQMTVCPGICFAGGKEHQDGFEIRLDRRRRRTLVGPQTERIRHTCTEHRTPEKSESKEGPQTT